MSETIEGVYRDGTIQLQKPPQDCGPSRVLVTFVRDAEAPTEEERLDAIRELIEQMRTSQVTGGRGYLFREELYADRLYPRDK